MDTKRLYRSRRERMICGVCGGVAEYFGRLAFVLFVFAGGSGFLAYLIAAIIIPDDPRQ